MNRPCDICGTDFVPYHSRAKICPNKECRKEASNRRVRKFMKTDKGKELRPSLESTLLEMASVVAKRSTCSRRNNGAVIATEKGVVLSTGYNGSLSGMDHCDHDCDCGAVLMQTESHSETCSAHPDNGCTLAVHAESNAVYFAARNGVSVENAIIYCTTEPCVKCAEAIVQSGISKCVYELEYRSHAGIELLKQAGVTVERVAK